MNRIHELREQIDACRPCGDDLHLPELAGLARAADEDRAVAEELVRSQRFDGAVGSALHDIPVPTGLLDRLLAATSAAPPLAMGELPIPAADVAVNLSPAVGKSRKFSRRMLMAIFGTCAAAVVLVGVGLSMIPAPPQVVSQADLQLELAQWAAQVRTPTGWTPSKQPVPAAFVYKTDMRREPVQWRSFKTASGDRAVAFDFDQSGQMRAILFVVSTPAKYQVRPTPYAMLSTTGTTKVGAWQRGTLLYVLFIDASGLSLDQFIKSSNQA